MIRMKTIININFMLYYLDIKYLSNLIKKEEEKLHNTIIREILKTK
jgi:hypothetical protein